MQTHRRLAVALLVLALWAPPEPARADCCDNFWGCLGAVATAGVSCAADAAAQAVLDEFVAETRRTREDGKRQMDAQKQGNQREIELKLRQVQLQRREIDQKAQRASSDAAQAVRQARAHAEQAAPALALAPRAKVEATAVAGVTRPESRFELPPDALKPSGLGPDGSKPSGKAKSKPKGSSISRMTPVRAGIQREGMAGAPREQESAVESDRLIRAVIRAEREIDDLMLRKQEAIRASQESDRRMQSAFDAGIRSANTLFESSFVVPLTGIIGQVAPLDPVAAGVMIAVLVNEIDQIKRKFENEVLPAIREVDRSYQAEQAEAERQAGQARSAADRVEELVLAMKRAANDPDERNVRSLEIKLGDPFPSSGRKKKSARAARRPKGPSTGILPAGRAAKQSLHPRAGLSPQASGAVMASWQRVSSGLDRSLGLARQLERAGGEGVADVEVFRIRTNGHFESTFAGQDEPGIEKKEQELLREAARRFSSDAKVRKAAEALIREQALVAKAKLPRAREQSVSPPDRPQAVVPLLERPEGSLPPTPRKGGFHRR